MCILKADNLMYRAAVWENVLKALRSFDTAQTAWVQLSALIWITGLVKQTKVSPKVYSILFTNIISRPICKLTSMFDKCSFKWDAQNKADILSCSCIRPFKTEFKFTVREFMLKPAVLDASVCFIGFKKTCCSLSWELFSQSELRWKQW